jgi:group I intron endonuclease
MYKDTGNSGIYKIQSIRDPNKEYIGSTLCFYSRWQIHLCLLRKNKHYNNKLQRHYNKHGEKDLIFSIITHCPKEDLLSQEQSFIDTLKPWFNLNKRAERGSDKFSEETIEKMRKKSIGRKLTETAKRKIGDFWRGKPSHRKGTTHTTEAKQKIKEARKRQVFTPECLKKRGDSIKRAWIKRKLTPMKEETRDKIRKSMIGTRRALGSKHTAEMNKEKSERMKTRTIKRDKKGRFIKYENNNK